MLEQLPAPSLQGRRPGPLFRAACPRRSASDRRRVVAQLPPGDPHHPPAVGQQQPVASPDPSRRPAGPVDRAAVELDDQPLLRPEAIDLEESPCEREVRIAAAAGAGRCASRSAWKRSSSSLRVTRRDASIAEQSAQHPRPSSPRIALEQHRHREPVGQAAHLSLVEGLLQLAPSTIAARSNSVRDTEVTGMPSTTSISSGRNAERWARDARSRPRNRAGLVTSGSRPTTWQQSPQCPAERWLRTASGPAGEHRRHPATPRLEQAMAYGVDPAWTRCRSRARPAPRSRRVPSQAR